MRFFALGSRSRLSQILVTGVVTGLVGLVVVESLDTRFFPTTVAMIVAGVLSLLAVGAPGRRFCHWAAIAAAASVVVSLVTAVAPHRPDATFGLVELSALLWLIVNAVRTRRPVQAASVTAGLSAAVLLLPLRLSESDRDQLEVIVPFLLGLLPVAIAIGLFLRQRDRLRAAAVAAARQDQRLEYARDLHDFVAHHITAIAAHVKAIRFTYGSETAPTPAELAVMLAGVEDAADQALASMRTMVSELRAPGPAPLEPAPDLAQLLEQSRAEFTAAGASIDVAIDDGLGRQYVPDRIASVVHRVVQESLTNVRKHAHGATTVSVVAQVSPSRSDWIDVTITDDGVRYRPGPGNEQERGYGLRGLSELIEGAGGCITAAENPDSGWRVHVELPLSENLVGSREHVL
ncbi:sensor histidine kinase [Prescottella agglutinans]|uniref:sensor histidine kinase n=1 Tax=Prescottella agglutinans TaxID=1644129 RepID=UPI003D97EF2C